MAEQDPNSETAWWDVWGKLKGIIEQLDTAVANLQASRDYALSRPNLKDEYNEKMADVQSMRDKAIWLRDTVKNAMAYFGVTLEGLRTEVGDLGFVPLLIWPVVIAGVAWLGSKALDLFEFSQRVDEQRRLESAGVPAQDAANIVAQTASAGSVASAIGNVGKTLAVIGVLAGIGYLIYRSQRHATA